MSFYNPMDYSLPRCSVHSISQARKTAVGYYFPSPGNLPNPGIEPMSPVSPALAGGFFSIEPPGKPDRQNRGLPNLHLGHKKQSYEKSTLYVLSHSDIWFFHILFSALKSPALPLQSLFLAYNLFSYLIEKIDTFIREIPPNSQFKATHLSATVIISSPFCPFIKSVYIHPEPSVNFSICISFFLNYLFKFSIQDTTLPRFSFTLTDHYFSVSLAYFFLSPNF